MNEKPKTKFRRPLDKEETTVWKIAHSLQSDLDYLLMEETFSASKMQPHALKMILKHIIRELDDIKQLSKNLPSEEEK